MKNVLKILNTDIIAFILERTTNIHEILLLLIQIIPEGPF